MHTGALPVEILVRLLHFVSCKRGMHSSTLRTLTLLSIFCNPLSPCLIALVHHHYQVQLAGSCDFVMTNGGLPGGGDAMGDTARVFEAVCKRHEAHSPASWPETHQQRLQQLLIQTSESLGLGREW